MRYPVHLYRMHEMVATWQAPSQIAFIIAGHTSFARLSAITDVIKEAALAGIAAAFPAVSAFVVKPTVPCA